MSEIAYIEGTEKLTKESVRELYESVGWTKYTEDPDSLWQAVNSSDFVVSAHLDDQLVGLARSLSDDVAIHYLQDILIRPDRQRMRIGRALLEQCLYRFRHVRAHVLLTDDRPEQKAFYEALGFRNAKTIEQLNCYIRFGK